MEDLRDETIQVLAGIVLQKSQFHPEEEAEMMRRWITAVVPDAKSEYISGDRAKSVLDRVMQPSPGESVARPHTKGGTDA